MVNGGKHWGRCMTLPLHALTRAARAPMRDEAGGSGLSGLSRLFGLSCWPGWKTNQRNQRDQIDKKDRYAALEAAFSKSS